MNDLPIALEILQKGAAIPGLLASLSYVDEKSAVHYMRIYGEKQMPISELFDELSNKLSKAS